MTSKQRYAILLDWWPAACESQHWHKNDRPLRLQIISQSVGRQIASMSDLDNSRDIDQVKAYLKYLADDLNGALEVGHPDPGERRRLLWLIRRDSAQLAIGDRQSAISYALALAHDKFHLTPGLATLEDLSTDQLRHLMMTLFARLSARRRSNNNASLTSEEQFTDDTDPAPKLAADPF